MGTGSSRGSYTQRCNIRTAFAGDLDVELLQILEVRMDAILLGGNQKDVLATQEQSSICK